MKINMLIRYHIPLILKPCNFWKVRAAESKRARFSHLDRNGEEVENENEMRTKE